MNYVLKTKQLTKQYGEQIAVDHINMTIQKGDIYGLIGQNGAGKTTFMRMICGLASETSGTIELFGSSDLEVGRKKMGCTIENPALYPYMTAEENMEIYRQMLHIKDKKVVSDLLDFVGLSDVKNKKSKDFSLGMKQRLMIAIALIGNPEFLILDEPMNGLDPFGIKEIRDLLLKLSQERGITIIVSSHILDELSKIANRYGIIHNGKMIKEFDAKNLNAEGQNKFKLTVNDPKKALKILTPIIPKIEHEGNDLYLFGELKNKGEIVKLMVTNNIDVTALVKEEHNLETYFMEIIGGK